MFVEVLALGSGVPVLLASAVGLLAARSAGGGAAEIAEPRGPVMGAVTEAALERLPLVAPDRASYGTASYLLIQAAQEPRTITSIPAPSRGTRAA